MARRKNVEPAALGEVREWARQHGHEVGNRGRVKAEVLADFTKQTGRPVGKVETPETR
jgi:hypothetical protein